MGKWAEKGALCIKPYQWIRSYFSRHVHAATAPSRYTLEMLTKRGFFPNAIHQVIPNSHGLSENELSKQGKDLKTAGDTKEIRFLYLGRLEQEKGIELLCESFANCAKKFSHIKLDIVGWGGSQSLLQEKYSRHPQIQLRGKIFGRKKDEIVASSDIVVVPSICPEVFGLVITEAYTWGKTCHCFQSRRNSRNRRRWKNRLSD